jgi:hypothetical protein
MVIHSSYIYTGFSCPFAKRRGAFKLYIQFNRRIPKEVKTLVFVLLLAQMGCTSVTNKSTSTSTGLPPEETLVENVTPVVVTPPPEPLMKKVLQVLIISGIFYGVGRYITH